MATMRRTQIYLEPELSAALEREAHKRGISKAELIRVAARELLRRAERRGDDAIRGVIGLGTGSAGRTSEEHDRVLAAHAFDSSPT